MATSLISIRRSRCRCGGEGYYPGCYRGPTSRRLSHHRPGSISVGKGWLAACCGENPSAFAEAGFHLTCAPRQRQIFFISHSTDRVQLLEVLTTFGTGTLIAPV